MIESLYGTVPLINMTALNPYITLALGNHQRQTPPSTREATGECLINQHLNVIIGYFKNMQNPNTLN